MTSLQLRSPATQRGFTLIEILVTVVLISVGLLGVAALQLTTLRGNQDAYVRSQASVLAGDILDRMRVNPFDFRAGSYSVDFNGEGDDSTRAGQDLRDWQRDIDRTLPGTDTEAAGRIERTYDAATRRHVVTVTIRWRERGDGSGADEQNDTDGADGELRQFQTRSEI
nr:type IV pilus modification protein PilV [uncultured Steroidobacter sp.]